MTLACAFSACGGGSPTPSPFTQAAQPPAVVQAPRAVLIDDEGDSTMVGFEVSATGNNFNTVNNEPAVAQSLLQAQFGSSVTIENNGVSGATVLERLTGAPPYTTPYKPDEAQIVLGNWALNDAIQQVSSPEQYQSQLVEFVNLVRASGNIPVLEEPNPVYPSSAIPNLASYVSAMDYVAASMGVPLVQQYAYIQSIPNWQSMLTFGGVHPDDRLYAIKAQREADILAPLVGWLRVQP